MVLSDKIDDCKRFTNELIAVIFVGGVSVLELLTKCVFYEFKRPLKYNFGSCYRKIWICPVPELMDRNKSGIMEWTYKKSMFPCRKFKIKYALRGSASHWYEQWSCI